MERLGGQGFLSVNRVCELLPFAHAGITAEGDSSVLMQKVAKELATSVAMKTYVPPQPQKQREQIFKMAQIGGEIQTLIDLVYHREIEIINELVNTTKQKVVEGKSIYDIWMYESGDLVQMLARAFAERVVVQFCWESIQKAPQGAKYVLTQYFYLHLQTLVLNNLSWYFVNEYISKNSSKSLLNQFKNTVKVVHLFALRTVNSFGIPEHLLTAPIAS